MKDDRIPSEHHVLRHVGWRLLRKDENEVVVGCFGNAFALRPGETSLSVSWLEYFSGSPQVQIEAAIKAVRSARGVGAKAAFARGNVGHLQDICKASNAKIRVIHEPTKSDPAHSGIRRIPSDNADLLDLIASEVFAELTFNSSVI